MEQSDVRPAGAPWLTLALLATFVAVYGVELLYGDNDGLLTPSLRTLLSLGGSSYNLAVGNGEWFRVISAPFLHAGPLHLLINGFIFLWGGAVLERLVGRAWFAAIYAISGVTGSLVSLAVNPANVLSVGASGAIMGVMASLFVASFHFPPGPQRVALRVAALQVLVPSLIPIAAMTGQPVDYGAHAGGALGGAVTAFAMVLLWRRGERLPRLRLLAAVVGLGALAAAGVTTWKIARRVHLQTLLIPQNQFPGSDAEWKAKGAGLAARYPHDPRLRLVSGMTLLDANNNAAAARELRAGLEDAVTMKGIVNPRVEMLLRTYLATAVVETNPTEALVVAAPVCRLEDTPDTADQRMQVERLGLCEEGSQKRP